MLHSHHKQVTPGLSKLAAGLSNAKLLSNILKGFGQDSGAVAFRDLGSNAFRHFGNGGAGTRGIVNAWKASPRMRQATAGALVGGGAGGAYGTAEGYREGGIPGAMWGGFRSGMTGAGLGGIAGGLGGDRIHRALGSIRTGVGEAAKEYTK